MIATTCTRLSDVAAVAPEVTQAPSTPEVVVTLIMAALFFVIPVLAYAATAGYIHRTYRNDDGRFQRERVTPRKVDVRVAHDVRVGHRSGVMGSEIKRRNDKNPRQRASHSVIRVVPLDNDDR